MGFTSAAALALFTLAAAPVARASVEPPSVPVVLVEGGSDDVSDSTPTLAVTSRDPDDDLLTYTFVLSRWGEDVPAVTHEQSGVSGEFVTWTVPEGILQNGRGYRVEVSVSDGESMVSRSRSLVFRSSWSRLLGDLGEVAVRALFWSPVLGVSLVVLGLALASAWGRPRLGGWVTAVGVVVGLGGLVTLAALLSQIGS